MGGGRSLGGCMEDALWANESEQLEGEGAALGLRNMQIGSDAKIETGSFSTGVFFKALIDHQYTVLLHPFHLNSVCLIGPCRSERAHIKTQASSSRARSCNSKPTAPKKC